MAKWKPTKRILFVIAGYTTFCLILVFTIGRTLDEEAGEWIDAADDWAWAIAILLIISDVIAPIPATSIITLLGKIYGPLLGGAIGTLGTFLAGVVGYGLTRMFGPRFAHWLLRDDLETAEIFFKRSGSFAVACSRWLPLLPEAISCLAGLARMPFGKYCLALLCGSLPMAYSYAALSTISENQTIPLVISIIMPLPIWWIASRLLYLRSETISS